MIAETWRLPPKWHVPRDWIGERCFVLCTGESLKAQTHLVPKLKGRIIAVKHAVLIRPDADVLFLSGEGCVNVARVLIPVFTGQYVIVRGKSDPEIPAHVKRVGRSKVHRLLDRPGEVMGRDSGTSAIDIARQFGATEIIVLGMDMQGGHYCAHPMQYPPESHFRQHMEVLPMLAADAKARGIRIVNCSPTSAVTCFERQSLEMFL